MAKTTDRQIVNGQEYLLMDSAARAAISEEITAREAEASGLKSAINHTQLIFSEDAQTLLPDLNDVTSDFTYRVIVSNASMLPDNCPPNCPTNFIFESRANTFSGNDEIYRQKILDPTTLDVLFARGWNKGQTVPEWSVIKNKNIANIEYHIQLAFSAEAKTIIPDFNEITDNSTYKVVVANSSQLPDNAPPDCPTSFFFECRANTFSGNNTIYQQKITDLTTLDVLFTRGWNEGETVPEWEKVTQNAIIIPLNKPTFTSNLPVSFPDLNEITGNIMFQYYATAPEHCPENYPSAIELGNGEKFFFQLLFNQGGGYIFKRQIIFDKYYNMLASRSFDPHGQGEWSKWSYPGKTTREIGKNTITENDTLGYEKFVFYPNVIMKEALVHEIIVSPPVSNYTSQIYVGTRDQNERFVVTDGPFELNLVAGQSKYRVSIPVDAARQLAIKLPSNTPTDNSEKTAFQFSSAESNAITSVPGDPVFMYSYTSDDSANSIEKMEQQITENSKTIAMILRKNADWQYHNYLAIGNSITRHAIVPGVWFGDWGMAASIRDKDYVHLVGNTIGADTIDSYGVIGWETNEAGDRSVYLDQFDSLNLASRDLITIGLSENVRDISSFKADYEELIDYIRERSPSSKILLLGSIFFSEPKDNIIRQVAASQNVLYADCHTSLKPDDFALQVGSSVYGDDGIWHVITPEIHQIIGSHPGDSGMKYLADQIIDTLALDLLGE